VPVKGIEEPACPVPPDVVPAEISGIGGEVDKEDDQRKAQDDRCHPCIRFNRDRPR
jgi:hypothetical protein